jgi:hypothetical protein
MKTKQISDGRWAHSWGVGRDIEDVFLNLFKSMDILIEKSSLSDDKYKHIDFYTGMGSVDVKGKRKLDSIWLETVNTRGYHGWLKGEADWIAFHFQDLNVFKLFKRVELLEFVEQNVTEKTENSRDFLKYYNRSKWGQKDELVKVSYDHIKHLYHLVISC